MSRTESCFKVFLLAAALLILSPGCRREDARPYRNSDQIPVNISALAAVGNTVNGVMLSSVRIIAVNSSSGRVEFNEYRYKTDGPDGGNLQFEYVDHGSDVSGNYIATLSPGTYEIFVIVNESAEHTVQLNAVAGRAQLAAIKITDSDIATIRASEQSMICVGSVSDVQLQNVEGAWVKTPGTDWRDALNVDIERIVSKISVKVCKDPEGVGDTNISIKKAELSNVPKYSYMLPKVYDGTYSGREEIFAGSDDDLPENSEIGGEYDYDTGNWADIAVGYIIPENLIGDSEDATMLTLTTEYLESAAGAEPYQVTYSMPLQGHNTDQNIRRNTHYTLYVIVKKPGEFEYTTFIEYEVADWDPAGNIGDIVHIDDIISVYDTWELGPGAYFEPGDDILVMVPNNGVVTVVFNLMHPPGAQWKAYLTNDRDFALTGDTEGTAGTIGRIDIRPTGEAASDDISTELYILIRTVMSEVEYDLNKDWETGLGHRCVIKQIQSH